MKTVALVTLGCSKNLVDSEVMLGYLREAGFMPVVEPDKADVVVLNTCGFIKPAKEEAAKAIEEIIHLKKETKKARVKVIVAGCYVERYKSLLSKRYPEVDAWLGVGDFNKVVRAAEGREFRRSRSTFLYDHESPRLISTPSGWAYVKISEGCSHECAFCAIPLIKGPYRSRRISSILREARDLAQRGIKEITLISQDTTYFGRDKGMEDGLARLLQELIDIKEIAWVRFLYGYPEEISDALLDVMREEKICSYLDIPFQHSHPGIIRNMKRAMDGKKALRLLEKIRKKLPDVAVRTSLVVGFPGEGRREFGDLKKFVRTAEFDHLGVFVYSSEEGTSSYFLGDPIPEAEKQSRKNEVMEIQAGISFRNNQKYLFRQLDVLVEGTWKENPSNLIGRARFQAPEVDGVIFIDPPPGKRHVSSSIQKVEITAADIYDLRGKLVE